MVALHDYATFQLVVQDGQRGFQALCENRSCHKFARLDLVHVTPDPAFSRFDGANQRMLRFVEMLSRMLVLGRVATANVSASEAKTQVDPRITRLGTVLTHMFIGFSDFDLIKVGAIFWHRFLLYLLMKVSQVLVSSPSRHWTSRNTAFRHATLVI